MENSTSLLNRPPDRAATGQEGSLMPSPGCRHGDAAHFNRSPFAQRIRERFDSVYQQSPVAQALADVQMPATVPLCVGRQTAAGRTSAFTPCAPAAPVCHTLATAELSAGNRDTALMPAAPLSGTPTLRPPGPPPGRPTRDPRLQCIAPPVAQSAQAAQHCMPAAEAPAAAGGSPTRQVAGASGQRAVATAASALLELHSAGEATDCRHEEEQGADSPACVASLGEQLDVQATSGGAAQRGRKQEWPRTAGVQTCGGTAGADTTSAAAVFGSPSLAAAKGGSQLLGDGDFHAARSRRVRLPPLEFWRNQTVIRDSSGRVIASEGFAQGRTSHRKEAGTKSKAASYSKGAFSAATISIAKPSGKTRGGGVESTVTDDTVGNKGKAAAGAGRRITRSIMSTSVSNDSDAEQPSATTRKAKQIRRAAQPTNAGISMGQRAAQQKDVDLALKGSGAEQQQAKASARGGRRAGEEGQAGQASATTAQQQQKRPRGRPPKQQVTNAGAGDSVDADIGQEPPLSAPLSDERGGSSSQDEQLPKRTKHVRQAAGASQQVSGSGRAAAAGARGRGRRSKRPLSALAAAATAASNGSMQEEEGEEDLTCRAKTDALVSISMRHGQLRKQPPASVAQPSASLADESIVVDGCSVVGSVAAGAAGAQAARRVSRAAALGRGALSEVVEGGQDTDVGCGEQAGTSCDEDGWTPQEVARLHELYVSVNPTHPNYWQHIARQLRKTADECYGKVFSSLPSPQQAKPKPKKYLPAAAAESGAEQLPPQGGKLGPAAARRMARTAWWAQRAQQQADKLGAAGVEGLAVSFLSAMQKQEATDRYIDAVKRRTSKALRAPRTLKAAAPDTGPLSTMTLPPPMPARAASGSLIQPGALQRDLSTVDAIRAMLAKSSGAVHEEEDEEEGGDNYFSLDEESSEEE